MPRILSQRGSSTGRASTKMKTDKDIVARQYNAWAYPAPITDMAAWVAEGNVEFSDPSVFGLMYWPKRTGFADLDILIAGCGTNQAANIAFKNPQCRVTGIDLSESSLAHQKFLMEKHGLGNLRLAQLDLESVVQLGQDFDLIISTGVLHHLPDPDAGLRSLRGVLRPGGAMYLMVYGKSRRVGVYMLQEMFRLLGLGQAREDVELVKHVLRNLPADHAAQTYLRDGPDDLASDTGVVDTFLHRVDRAYSVPEALEFVARNGLKFMRWGEPADYALAGAIPFGDPLLERALALPEADQWQVFDLLTQSKGTHTFVVCHAARPDDDFRLRFDGEAFLGYMPQIAPGLQVVRPADIGRRGNIRLSRLGNEFELDYRAAQVLAHADGRRSVGAILVAVNHFGMPPAQAVDMARALFSHLANTGHLVYRLPA
jgi:SAM-dependent methyltransferase